MRVITNNEDIYAGDTSWRQLQSAAWIGAGAGVLTWILSYLLANYVVGQVACRLGTSLIQCSDTAYVSGILALILVGILALILTVRQRLYRPLFVILASTLVLWGIGGSWLVGMGYLGFLLTVLISALVYSTMTWFSTVRNFWVALAWTATVIVLFRFIIMS